MFLLMFSYTLFQDMQSGVVTSLYLLCCILKIVKIKDLANTVVAALIYPLKSFTKCSGGNINGYASESQGQEDDNLDKCCSSGFHPQSLITRNNCSSSNMALR